MIGLLRGRLLEKKGPIKFILDCRRRRLSGCCAASPRLPHLAISHAEVTLLIHTHVRGKTLLRFTAFFLPGKKHFLRNYFSELRASARRWALKILFRDECRRTCTCNSHRAIWRA